MTHRRTLVNTSPVSRREGGGGCWCNYWPVSWENYKGIFPILRKNSSFILAMRKNLLELNKFFQQKHFQRECLHQILRFNYTTNHKTAAFGRNFLYRSMLTAKTMEKRNITKAVATDVVKPLAPKLTGVRARDMIQALIRLREREQFLEMKSNLSVKLINSWVFKKNCKADMAHFVKNSHCKWKC